MQDVPIKFEHHGKEYSGRFSAVGGADGKWIWYLLDDTGNLLGVLRINEHTKNTWVFDDLSDGGKLSELADHFASYLIAANE